MKTKLTEANERATPLAIPEVIVETIPTWIAEDAERGLAEILFQEEAHCENATECCIVMFLLSFDLLPAQVKGDQLQEIENTWKRVKIRVPMPEPIVRPQRRL